MKLNIYAVDKKVCIGIGIGIGIGGCGGGCGGGGCGGIKLMSVCISSRIKDGGTVDRRNNVCNSSFDGNGKSISRFEPSESVFRIRIICIRICWGG